MVSVKEIKNKEGEVLKTEKGDTLFEYRFEAGDMFIPEFNSVLEKSHDAVVDGEETSIVDYKIKCKVKTKEGVYKSPNGESLIFVTLTPTQASSLKKKIAEGVKLNQNLFVAYEYESDKYKNKKFVGVGLKGETEPAKDFEDFNSSKEAGETSEDKAE